MGIFLFILINLFNYNTLTGTVKDSKMGDELVMVKVTSSIDETYTDLNGNYTLNFTEGDTITFTYIGYETKQLCENQCKVVFLDR
jgi:hypothetical protein